MKLKAAKITRLVFSALLITQYITAQSGLNNYLEQAATHNPELQTRFYEYHAALEQIPQVGALPDPQVMIGYFVLPVETRLGPQQLKVSLSQQFPWFGTLKAKKSVAAERAEAKFQAFEAAKYHLFYKVKSTWYDLYVLQKAIAITEENLTFLRSFRELALIKYEGGKASMVDVLRADMDLAELDNQLELLKANQGPLRQKFEELLSTPLDGPVALPDTLPTDSLLSEPATLLDSILSQNPRLALLEHQAAAFEKQSLAAKKMGMPQFSLGVDYINLGQRKDMEVADNGRDGLVAPMLGVSLPIYRSKYRALVEEARWQREAVEQEKTAAQNRLETQLATGWRDYQDAQRRVALYQRLQQIAQQALSLLITEYSSAGKAFEEVLRMERLKLKYALELEKARADVNEAVAFIEMLMARE